jgi:hypothetical protein
MIVRSMTLAAVVMLAAVPAQGQALRRPPTKAFPLSVTPFLALGWGGTRVVATIPEICSVPDCIKHKVGSGPQLGVELQLPLAGTLGLGVTGVAGRPSRLLCAPLCLSPERLTVLHGAALLLWRFKARAPIYFGLGPAVNHIDPGPVQGQSSAVTEFGGSLVLAYDFTFGPRVGGRVGWWNYFMKPSDEALPAGGRAKGLAWDTQIGLGVRLLIGS